MLLSVFIFRVIRMEFIKISAPILGTNITCNSLSNKPTTPLQFAIGKHSIALFYYLSPNTPRIRKERRWNFYARWISMLNVLQKNFPSRKQEIYHFVLQKLLKGSYKYFFRSVFFSPPSRTASLEKAKKLLTRFTIIYTLHVRYIAK